MTSKIVTSRVNADGTFTIISEYTELGLPIPMHELENSGHIKSTGYCPAARVMRIQFGSGTYDYFDVPPEVYEELRINESPGGYLATAIKNVYRYTKQPETTQ